MSILILVAHPDDDVLGMGGTIHKLAEQGENIIIAYFNTGLDSRGKASKEEYDKMEESIRESCKILGVLAWIIEDFPDNKFDTVPLLDLVKKCEEIIDMHNPEVIYTHSSNELNIDHQLIHKAVITACRPPAFPNIKKILCFGVPEALMFNPDFQFKPNYFEKLELKNILAKMEALCCYESEIRKSNHPRSEYGMKLIAEYYGFYCDSYFAEPFELGRCIK